MPAGRITVETREPEAAVVILCARVPEDSVFLIRRSQRPDDPWSGHWSLPGGHRDPDDRDLLDTALRELEEECAIRLAREQMERALPLSLARRKVGRFVLVAPFLLRTDCRPVAILNPSEAIDAHWIPLRTILDPACHSLCSVPDWPQEMLFPAIDLNGIPLWGFTYRLLADWLDLASHGIAREDAGFEFACSILDFVLARGLTLRHTWTESAIPRVAAVKGEIPVTAVRHHFSRPGLYVPVVNCLEVQSNYIRVAGLAFEEYFIHAAS
jgi:8-oxo-dGTP pyrophosphatase MutT (NUDIX family)